ncbi:MAG: hypothetical protein AAB439_00615 [Patescibacteria group bacterium]|mgnify:FL=1
MAETKKERPNFILMGGMLVAAVAAIVAIYSNLEEVREVLGIDLESGDADPAAKPTRSPFTDELGYKTDLAGNRQYQSYIEEGQMKNDEWARAQGYVRDAEGEYVPMKQKSNMPQTILAAGVATALAGVGFKFGVPIVKKMLGGRKLSHA